jgi:diphosphomevalonate decarboxylase
VSAGTATAIAHPNIALAKYWGKTPFGSNLPAVPSLSVTLSGMLTRTTVTFDAALASDELLLGGATADARATARVAGLLDRIRARAGISLRARVTSANDFPTASGLASSASAFAALAVAATEAAGLALDPSEASDLARRTSVSAARSVFGGFVALRAGLPEDAALSAEPVAAAEHWSDLRVVVAVTHEGAKAIGSTDGMLHTVKTSAYYPAWVASAPALFERVRAGILARDLELLGTAAEESALLMHASAIAAAPGILYWIGATVEAIAAVKRMRARGVAAYATIDAGPHVKVITTAADEDAVVRGLGDVPGVLRTIRTSPGGPARVIAGEGSPS